MSRADAASLPEVLLVGGVDSSGGAGLDADREAALALECASHEVASAITDQDLFEVRRVEERMMWAGEAEAHLDGGQLAVMKFGLLPGVASIVEAARLIARSRRRVSSVSEGAAAGAPGRAAGGTTGGSLAGAAAHCGGSARTGGSRFRWRPELERGLGSPWAAADGLERARGRHLGSIGGGPSASPRWGLLVNQGSAGAQ